MISKQTPQIMQALDDIGYLLVIYSQIKAVIYNDKPIYFDQIIISANNIEFIRSTKSGGTGEIFTNTRGQKGSVSVKLDKIDGSLCLTVLADNVHIFVPFPIFDRGLEFKVDPKPL